MLIKDPYLSTQNKYLEIKSNPIQPRDTTFLSQPVFSQAQRNRAFSGQVQQLQGKVKVYERELKSVQEAYARQEEAARKMLGYNNTNREYHEAMRLRNFQLNTKLKDVMSEMQVAQHRTEQQQMRYNYDKDMLLKKYQEQTEQTLRLKASFNSLLEQKARMEEQIGHLTFMIQKQAHQHELQIKQFAFRMESMDRTYKNLLSAKDEEVAQLTQRLRLYEDENRRLNDINKTLHLTKDKPDKIDNLSQIHHPQSYMKSHIKERNKQNDDGNIPNSIFKQKDNQELKEQKTINQDLRKQLQELKQKMNTFFSAKTQFETDREKVETDRMRSVSDGMLLETSKWQGIMNSISTVRQGINKEVFELFFKSVRDGEKRKQNSLVIFIQNWKCLSMQRLQPYIRSYFEARNNLKQIIGTKKAKDSPYSQKMQEVIPLHVGTRVGRNNINQWILSTIQFTKNQKQSGKKSLNNYILFLFRLLTIQYRIKYPMQGKSYQLDQDVTNELLHQIIKGVELIFKYQ